MMTLLKIASMIMTNAEFCESKSFIEDQNLYWTSTSQAREVIKYDYKLIAYALLNAQYLVCIFYNFRVLSSVTF